MSKLIDLVGQKFGRLTVLYRIENAISPCGSVSSVWHCKCDCGNECDVLGKSLKSGNTKSCGCLLDEISKTRYTDLSGKIFGRLTVLYRTNDYVSPSGDKRIKWHCRCNCGNECDVLGVYLTSNKTTSCGCYSKEITTKYNKEHKRKTNKYTIKKDYIEAETNSGYKFYIDIDDEWVFDNYCWFENQGYIHAIDRKTRKTVALHRLVLKYDGEFEIDHINGKTFDNRKSNLRKVTRSQNQMNKSKLPSNTSGVTGVSYHQTTKKYAAYIGVCGELVNLGEYNSISDAVAARKAAEEKYFGEYSYDNSRNKPSQDQGVT